MIMSELQNLVSDAEVFEAFQNTNFGETPNRFIIADTLLKLACGYHTGRTATIICIELGLVRNGSYNLTKKGKEYMFHAFKISDK